MSEATREITRQTILDIEARVAQLEAVMTDFCDAWDRCNFANMDEIAALGLKYGKLRAALIARQP